MANARVDLAFEPPTHLARHGDAPLVTQVVRDLVVAHDDLHDPGGVAQVDEGDAAVIAATGDPAGQRDGVARVRRAQRAGVVRADH